MLVTCCHTKIKKHNLYKILKGQIKPNVVTPLKIQKKSVKHLIVPTFPETYEYAW